MEQELRFVCEECERDFAVTFEGEEEEVICCPFCGLNEIEIADE